MKTEFFEIVEFPSFITEKCNFSYIFWCRAAADRSRKMALVGNYSPAVVSKTPFRGYFAYPLVKNVRS